jgi:hypothetical protein
MAGVVHQRNHRRVDSEEIEGQPQILVHRKVLHLNYWTVAKNMDDCKLKKPVGLCDEARIVDSWTFIVPESSSVELMARGYINEGEYGRMQGMTDHYIQQISGLDDKKHPVYSIRIHDPKRIGELDVALVDRVVRGGFQPDPKNNLGLKACVEDAVGIFFSGPTGSAELFRRAGNKEAEAFFVFVSGRRSGYRSPRKSRTTKRGRRKCGSLERTGTVSTGRSARNLMEHFVKKDTMLWLGWQWRRRSSRLIASSRDKPSSSHSVAVFIGDET